MYKRRLVAILFLKNGWIVRSEEFKVHQIIGEPTIHAERLRQWNVDELILLDISRNKIKDFGNFRDDYKYKPVTNLFTFLKRFSFQCDMPLTFGGNITNFDDIKFRIEYGADKVSLNTCLYKNPEIVKKASEVFGRQAIVASIDCKLNEKKEFTVLIEGGSRDINIDPVDWALEVEKIGAGEILLQFIDIDGKGTGYNIEMINNIKNSVNIPVIACSGAGNKRQILECYNSTKADAVGAGNIFHFTENSYPLIKKFLLKSRNDIRALD